MFKIGLPVTLISMHLDRICRQQTAYNNANNRPLFGIIFGNKHLVRSFLLLLHHPLLARQHFCTMHSLLELQFRQNMQPKNILLM